MTDSEEIIALDVGGKRIGVARASTIAKIPEPLPAVNVDGTELEQIKKLTEEYQVTKLIVGLPRNQSGEETEQSQIVRDFASKLKGYEIVWQDESLTSVNAEVFLQQSGKNYTKADIDSFAAAQILNDYLETL